ncbi:nucleoside hydrolase [Acrocarpospora catenulata]|uniref:nucleoside hydrolase n=1 Tax=Acrocarpospora catenulata TaxID=2836182 RepID=UPI001BD9467C|nr:nucleoside hydrolase [Acrocarpospora catenulata]
MKRILALLLALTACTAPPPAPAQKVIIDTDMGKMNDDALATLLLARSGVEILGLTVVGGNTWPEEGVRHARALLDGIGRADIPVIPGDTATPDRRQGYSGALDHPRPEPYSAPKAAEFIAQQVTAHPGQVTILAIGPMTNIAKAVQIHPEIVPLVAQVVHLGGSTGDDAEFNWWFDPPAAQLALNAGFSRLTVIPADVVQENWDLAAAATLLRPEIIKGSTATGLSVGPFGELDLHPGPATLVLDLDLDLLSKTVQAVSY